MDPAPLWLAVERAFPVVGVRADIERRLGRGLTTALVADRMLVQSGIADRYPCPNSGGSDCPRRVESRYRGGYRAICGSHPPACADLTLDDADVRLWGLAEDRFFGALVAALGLSGRLPSRLPTVDTAWLIGAQAAATTQVVFLPQGDDGRIAAGITQVRDQLHGGLQILVPRAGTIGAESHQAARQGVAINGLDELLTSYERGQFRRMRSTPGQMTPIVRHTEEEPVFAVVFIDGARQSLTREQYEDIRRRSGDFTVFADAFTCMAERTVDGQRQAARRVKASMLAVLRVVLEANGQPVDVTAEGVPGLDTSVNKQVFQAARRAIDIPQGRSWALFKNHPVERRSDYLFSADPGVTSCFIFANNSGGSTA